MIIRIPPGPGQESVWDYPRPPCLEPTARRIRVVVGAVCLVDTTQAYRVLETSHPPVYYVPPEAVQMEYFERNPQQTFCEWKGVAQYYSLVLGERRVPNVAWFYPNPTPAFQAIAGYLAFYPSRADACYVDEELVQAQEGDFYGGWLTADIVGPFKGSVGTWGW